MEQNVSILKNIEDIWRRLKSKSLSNDGALELLNQLNPLISQLQSEVNVATQDGQYYSKLETNAIALWNLTVVRKSSGGIDTEVICRMRHSSCDLLNLVQNTDSKTDTFYKRKALMTVKTARSWLDLGKAEMADGLLVLAIQSIDQLRSFIHRELERGLISDDDKELSLLRLDEDLMKIYLYRAEGFCQTGDFEAAYSRIDEGRCLLEKQPEGVPYLSVSCYNLAVDCYHKRQYKQAVDFLERTVEIGQNNSDKIHLSRSYRLMANCYIEWDVTLYLDRAQHNADLANQLHAHHSGLLLMVKILFMRKDCDNSQISQVINTMTHLEHLTPEMVLKTTELLLQNERYTLAVDFMTKYEDRLPPIAEADKVFARHFKLLVDRKQYSEAETFITKYVEASQNATTQKDSASYDNIQKLIWEVATQFMEKEDYQLALKWYDYSTRILTGRENDETDYTAKLQRNRASCLTYIGLYDKAHEALDIADKLDSMSPTGAYIRLKLAIVEGHDAQANEALVKMCELLQAPSQLADEKRTNGLICLAAQLAFEKGRGDLTETAMEKLSQTSDDIHQVIMALRYLTRLRCNPTGNDCNDKGDGGNCDSITKATATIGKAYEKLKVYNDNIKDQCNGDDESTFKKLKDEVDWFLRTAWNLAIQCDKMPLEMHQLYTLCNKLIYLSGTSDQQWRVRQQTCLFMAAAAALDIAKQDGDDQQKKLWLEKALENVNACHDLVSQIGTSEGSVPELLLLLEFETKAWLRDPDVERTFMKAEKMKKLDPKTFEKLAAVCLESRCSDRTLFRRALNCAVKRHLARDKPNYEKISKIFYSLIDNSLTSDRARDEALEQFDQLLEILSGNEAHFPELDLLWFMTRAWNTGVERLNAVKLKEAEKWCNLALKFLHYLREQKPVYETKMKELHGELLIKLKNNEGLEE